MCEAKENETLCKCPNGYSGDGKTGCQRDTLPMCHNVACGTNAVCEEIDSISVNCKCPQGYVGNPLLKCQEGTEESDSDKLRESLIDAKCPLGMTECAAAISQLPTTTESRFVLPVAT